MRRELLLWASRRRSGGSDSVPPIGFSRRIEGDPDGPVRQHGLVRIVSKRRRPPGRPNGSLPTAHVSRVDVELGHSVYRIARAYVTDSTLAEEITVETLRRMRSTHSDVVDRRAVLAQVRRRSMAATSGNAADNAERTPTPRHESSDADHPTFLDALAGLDADTRCISVLHYIEDMSCADIAAVTGLPEPGVRVRLVQGRRMLAAAVDELADA